MLTLKAIQQMVDYLNASNILKNCRHKGEEIIIEAPPTTNEVIFVTFYQNMASDSLIPILKPPYALVEFLQLQEALSATICPTDDSTSHFSWTITVQVTTLKNDRRSAQEFTMFKTYINQTRLAPFDICRAFASDMREISDDALHIEYNACYDHRQMPIVEITCKDEDGKKHILEALQPLLPASAILLYRQDFQQQPLTEIICNPIITQIMRRKLLTRETVAMLKPIAPPDDGAVLVDRSGRSTNLDGELEISPKPLSTLRELRALQAEARALKRNFEAEENSTTIFHTKVPHNTPTSARSEYKIHLPAELLTEEFIANFRDKLAPPERVSAPLMGGPA